MALDTGATRTFVTVDTMKKDRTLVPRKARKEQIIMADDSLLTTDATVKIGIEDALIVPGMNQDLLSPNTFVDGGSTLILDADGGPFYK